MDSFQISSLFWYALDTSALRRAECQDDGSAWCKLGQIERWFLSYASLRNPFFRQFQFVSCCSTQTCNRPATSSSQSHTGWEQRVLYIRCKIPNRWTKARSREGKCGIANLGRVKHKYWLQYALKISRLSTVLLAHSGSKARSLVFGNNEYP